MGCSALTMLDRVLNYIRPAEGSVIATMEGLIWRQ
jgi:hypothetical protein